jgi:hypothetical protein
MFRSRIVLAMVMVCFAIMAFNSNPVMADDEVDQDILNGVEQIRQILNNKVIPQIKGIEVPKTGQTTSYDIGDDGDLQKGTPWPSPRFTDNGDGTVTDNLTELIWLKNANCDGAKTWADALTYCNNLADPQCELTDGSVAGDWRLPNVRELHSLIDFGNSNPALPNGHPFDNVQLAFYWSATTFAYYTVYAWSVDMYYGNAGYGLVVDGNKYSTFYVWPVRAGY